MRMIRLRLVLLAGAALAASTVAAQETPASSPALNELRASPPPSAPAVVVAPQDAPATGAEPIVIRTEEIDRPPVPPPPPPIPAIWSPAPTDAEGRSAYGLYLSGRLAGMRGDRETSAEYLAASQELAPEQPTLANETFLAALLAGDLDSVTRLSAEARTLPLGEAGRLATAVDALRRGDGRAARADITGQPFTPPFNRAVGYLSQAIAAQDGDWDTALAEVAPDPTEPTTALIQRQQRAGLLELRRRHDDAQAEYETLMAMPQGRRLYGINYGAFLERRGRRDDARDAYLAALAGPSPDPRALVELNRVNHRGRAPALPTIAQIGAEAMNFAALEASELGGQDLAVIYLQLSLALRPDDSVTLRLGQTLARAEHGQLAIETFGRVGQTNPIQYAAAQVGIAEILSGEERQDEALVVLQRADAVAPDQPAVARRLAAGLLDLKRFDDALVVLNRPSINTEGQSLDIRFLRGYALNQLGRIDEAEAELWTALQAAPDNPTILNQLGYMWVDTGRRVDQGAEMLSRAHAAEPENGNIQDSLGWAQFKQGNYEAAVETLEQAVAKQPANAEIVDHLGDAYWQVGRRREAGWQWTRVLTLDPDAERRAEVERKIASGLEPSAAPTEQAATAGEP
jgi:tetratricopeptide (TPR) repeat protein